MYPDLCDDWHQDAVECEIYGQVDWFSTCADIAYGETGWTKKDQLEYNRIFEGL